MLSQTPGLSPAVLLSGGLVMQALLEQRLFLPVGARLLLS